MAPDGGAVDHVLPIVGQAKLDKSFQHGVPNALFGPSAEPDIDRVPLAVSLMHVAPRAADPQNMQHAVEKTTVVLGRSCPASALGRQKRFDDGPFLVCQIAARQECLPKSILESEPR